MSYQLTKGRIPILLSMPHNGTDIPDEIAKTMTSDALKLEDTDWYLDRLYDFAIEQGAWMINPVYSRYVIDLNRPKDDVSLYPGQDTTELCPTSTFKKEAIYLSQAPDQSEILARIENYWQPYHSAIQQSLESIKKEHGKVLLFEAHSIKSIVPRFFEGKLTDFNFGNYNNKSCGAKLTEIINHWQPKGYSKVINGRFKGGYLTRQYGLPKSDIHSVQLELSQATYMDEERLSYDEEKAKRVKSELSSMLRRFQLF